MNRNGHEGVVVRFSGNGNAAVQFTSVLRHLRHYHPDWQLQVAASEDVKAIAGVSDEKGAALLVSKQRHEQAQRVYDVSLASCDTCFANWPSTPVERCLLDTFKLSPVSDLCRYQLPRDADAERQVTEFLEGNCRLRESTCGRYPVVVIDWEVTTVAAAFGTADWQRLIDAIRDMDRAVMIVGTGARATIAGDERVFHMRATGTSAALRGWPR